jgi:hypothetical protein
VGRTGWGKILRARLALSLALLSSACSVATYRVEVRDPRDVALRLDSSADVDPTRASGLRLPAGAATQRVTAWGRRGLIDVFREEDGSIDVSCNRCSVEHSEGGAMVVSGLGRVVDLYEAPRFQTSEKDQTVFVAPVSILEQRGPRYLPALRGEMETPWSNVVRARKHVEPDRGVQRATPILVFGSVLAAGVGTSFVVKWGGHALPDGERAAVATPLFAVAATGVAIMISTALVKPRTEDVAAPVLARRVANAP